MILGKVDVYITDFIGIALNKHNNTHRVSYSIPAAIHALSWAEDPILFPYIVE
jgi:hypothetical protein